MCTRSASPSSPAGSSRRQQSRTMNGRGGIARRSAGISWNAGQGTITTTHVGSIETLGKRIFQPEWGRKRECAPVQRRGVKHGDRESVGRETVCEHHALTLVGHGRVGFVGETEYAHPVVPRCHALAHGLRHALDLPAVNDVGRQSEFRVRPHLRGRSDESGIVSRETRTAVADRSLQIPMPDPTVSGTPVSRLSADNYRSEIRAGPSSDSVFGGNDANPSSSVSSSKAPRLFPHGVCALCGRCVSVLFAVQRTSRKRLICPMPTSRPSARSRARFSGRLPPYPPSAPPAPTTR